LFKTARNFSYAFTPDTHLFVAVTGGVGVVPAHAAVRRWSRSLALLRPSAPALVAVLRLDEFDGVVELPLKQLHLHANVM